jgi:hypothetical protein
MREYLGRDSEGRNRVREVFANFQEKKFFAPPPREDGSLPGWNGQPPDESVNVQLSNSEKYRRGFDLIKWDTRGKDNGGSSKNISNK